MDASDFFVQHYGRLHMQVERDFLHRLSEAQMRLRPHGLNSIAWLVWHMARYEDILNLLLVGRPQVLDEEHWLPRLNLSVRDVGTGMGDDEVSDLSARLDLAALSDYYIAVGDARWKSSGRFAPRHWMSSPTWNACARKASSGRTPCG